MRTICIDCRYLAERSSGIGEMVRALVDWVPTLAPDLRFILLRNPAHPGPLSHAANVIEQDVGHAANGPATMWWLPHVVDLSGVDLFHATFNIMPAGLSMPCIATIHDVMRLTDPGLCRSGGWGLVERIFHGHGIRRALRSAAAIATVSTASAEAIATCHPPAAARTHVTPAGVSRRFRPQRPDMAALATLGLDSGHRFILTVGQYAPYKNHEGALQGFALAFRDVAGIDLVLVQRIGNGAKRLLSLAETLGIGGRVLVLPEVPEDRLALLYAAASALLHPSFCEGFGNPVAEAMASGCPVVTSDRSAMPEVAAGAARLVDPHDPASIAEGLRRVVSDPNTAAQMRLAGLARAAELDWRRFAAANLAIYRQLLAQHVTEART